MSTAARGPSLVIDNIGSLITNDPTIGRGPLGIVDQASLVITNGVVEAVGSAGAVADVRGFSAVILRCGGIVRLA